METGRDRGQLNFASAVREQFAFLADFGFSVTESKPTIVRYGRDGLELDVYHGRQSFEIGFGMTRQGVRYALSELIRAADPVAAEGYRNEAATTVQGVRRSLARLKKLVERYGHRALKGDVDYFLELERLRKAWLEEYAMDVLEGNVRPKADLAFRSGDYRQAAELYEKIHARLSTVELKKLALALKRSGQ